MMWSRSLHSLAQLSATSITLSTSSSSSLPSVESPEPTSYFTQRQGNQDADDETDYSTEFFDRSFSSGAFVGDDSSAYARFARLHASHTNNVNRISGDSYEDPADRYAKLTRPTIETYRGMSNEELITLLRTRQEQVAQLRQIYENFHYEVDKHFRTTVLDYHDKALSLGQMHVQMQSKSYSDQRLILTKLREEQHRISRDVHIIMVVCVILVISFWVWVRRHYINRVEFQNKLENVLSDELNRPSIGAFGMRSDNLFSSVKFGGRSIETSWEKEMRLKQEAQRKVMQEAAAIAAANLAQSEHSQSQSQQRKQEEEEVHKEKNCKDNNTDV